MSAPNASNNGTSSLLYNSIASTTNTTSSLLSSSRLNSSGASVTEKSKSSSLSGRYSNGTNGSTNGTTSGTNANGSVGQTLPATNYRLASMDRLAQRQKLYEHLNHGSASLAAGDRETNAPVSFTGFIKNGHTFYRD